MDDLNNVIAELHEEVYNMGDGINSFVVVPQQKYMVTLKSFINLLGDHKDKNITSLGMITNSYSTVIYNTYDEKSYLDEILKDDTRCKIELDKFFNFVEAETGEEAVDYFWRKNGQHINTDYSMGKILWAIRTSPKLQADLQDDDLKYNISFGTIESYMVFKLTSNNFHSITSAWYSGLLNSDLAYDSDILDLMNLYIQSEINDKISIELEMLPTLQLNLADYGVMDMASETENPEYVFWTKKKHDYIEKRKMQKIEDKHKVLQGGEHNHFDDSTIGLNSLDSVSFDMNKREDSAEVHNKFHSELVAINHKEEDYKVVFNQKLKDIRIPLNFVSNDNSAKCIGNFVLDKGNILLVMEDYAHVIYCTGREFTSKPNADSIPIIVVDNRGSRYTIWGLYVYNKSCGNVIKYVKDELKLIKFYDKLDEFILNGDSPRFYRSPDNLYFIPAFYGMTTPSKQNVHSCMWGLNHTHSQVDICKSIVEGVCFLVYEMISDLQENHSFITNRKVVVSGSYSYSWTLLYFLSNLLKADLMKHNSLPGLVSNKKIATPLNPLVDVLAAFFCCKLYINMSEFRELRSMALGPTPEDQAISIMKYWTDIKFNPDAISNKRIKEWKGILEFCCNVDEEKNEVDNFIFKDKY